MAFTINVRPEVLGARLKAARTLKRLTQEAAAEALGVARTTIVAMEGGKRAVTPQELRALAKFYGAPEGELLDQERPDLQMEVDFRSTNQSNQAQDEASVAALLHRLATNTVQLENLVGQRPPKLDLPEIRLSKTASIEQQAEDAALALRTRLGIGLGPIQDLTALMEFELGLRVFERPLPSNVSGAVAFDEAVGGFVLLNSSHPLYRRRVTAGHEIGHPLIRKLGLSILLEGEEPVDREERFFDLFGVALLTPAAAVRKKADELLSMFGTFSVRHLLMMAVFFNVSIEAMTRRMVRIGILKPGTYENLRSKGIGLKHRERVLEEMPATEQVPPFTPRALLLASIAHQRGLLSEQQIASMLELDLVSVRRALDNGLGSVKEGALELSL
jgi:Zn-dependent peptidase ImmA (M78 family)/transcriptional regulator with XRE-family HTH domain